MRRSGDPGPEASGGRRRRQARLSEPVTDLSGFPAPLVVTALAEASRGSSRVTVSLSGVEIGVVTVDAVAELGLRRGRVLTRETAEALLAAVGRTRVLDKALDLLAVNARSSRDLRVRLRRAGANEPEIAWTIDRLLAQGYVDDAAYARQVARAKVLAGGVSRRKVVAVLRRRGVSADVADAAIEQTLSEVDLDEEGAALAAARKRLRALRALDQATRRQRLYAFLARRGYDGGVIRRVLQAVLSET